MPVDRFGRKLALSMSLALAVACGSARSGLLLARDGSAGASGVGFGGQSFTGDGGATGFGGSSPRGSTVASTGGHTTAGTGGRAGLADGGAAAGGNVGSDGRVAIEDNAGTGGAITPAVPTVSDSGYVTVNAGTTVLAGFISSSTAGSGSSIALTYGTSNFCASGTVAANSTYKSWANAGFSVNQDPSGASGSSSALVLTGTTFSIGYINKGGSQLQFQLYDGSNYWCTILPPSSSSTTVTIPFSSLNTQCWDGRGSPFTSGTAIRTVNLVVPGGNAIATPFDFCFLGLTIN